MTDDFLRQRNSVICRYPHSFEKLGLGKFEYMKGNKVMKILLSGASRGDGIP